jgi:D-alanyl-lipoteichoic acid acyltransferase DltB (MBOAT superfamily)
MSFFPKVLQGPIERPGSLLPQLHQPFHFDYEKARSGLWMIAWGFFKKVVIADRLAIIVNYYYADVSKHTGLGLLFATYAFAFQLYYDFSGYSDMAIGVARLFNIELTQNFKLPYLATTVTDFWRRWHISFSSWLQDYVFRPLQLRLRHWKVYGTLAALLVTFLVSGVWHGASWNFVVWGLIFGAFVMAEVLYAPLRKKLDKRFRLQKSWLVRAWRVALTFNLVSFAWIFFRANNFNDALYVVGHLFSGVRLFDCAKLVGKYGLYLPVFKGVPAFEQLSTQAPQVCLATLQDFPLFPGQFSAVNVVILLVSLFILLISSFFGARIALQRWHWLPRWLLYLVFALWLLFAVWMFEATGQAFQEFLYFRF